MSNQENTKKGGANFFSGFNQRMQFPADLENKPLTPFVNAVGSRMQSVYLASPVQKEKKSDDCDDCNTNDGNKLKISLGGQGLGYISIPSYNYPYPAGVITTPLIRYASNQKTVTLTLESNDGGKPHTAQLSGDASTIAKIAAVFDQCDVNAQHEPRSGMPLAIDTKDHLIYSKDNKECYCGAGVIFVDNIENPTQFTLGQSLYGYQDFGRLYVKSQDNADGKGELNQILKNIAFEEAKNVSNEVNDDTEFKNYIEIDIKGDVINSNNKTVKYRCYLLAEEANIKNKKYLNYKTFSGDISNEQALSSKNAYSMKNVNDNEKYLIRSRTVFIINNKGNIKSI